MSNRTTPNDHEEEEDAATWRSSDRFHASSNGSIDAFDGDSELPGDAAGADGDSGLNEELLLKQLKDGAEDTLILEAIIEAVDASPSVTAAIAPLADIDARLISMRNSTALAIEIERVNFDVGPTNLDDSVRMYLREIGQVKLLDAAREIELASAMERGTYLALRRKQLTGDFGEPPAADVLGRALFHAFHQGWPQIEDLYCRAYGNDTEITKDVLLKAVLPLSQVRPNICKAITAEYDLSPEELEASIRQRFVEWELFRPRCKPSVTAAINGPRSIWWTRSSASAPADWIRFGRVRSIRVSAPKSP